MQGEYRGDFTRDTFYQANHFCRVLMQQGRVQLDADWNEQTAITLHLLRSLARDLIGQHGGPNPPAGSNTPGGFAIGTVTSDKKTFTDLTIAPGHYYVDGILCEIEASTNVGNANVTGVTYLTQPDFPAVIQPDAKNPPALPNLDGPALVYLDVWERHLTYVQQDLIREVALGGPDTASRSQVVWQVKIQASLPTGLAAWPNAKLSDADWQNWINVWQPANRGWLKAQIQTQAMSTCPCVISPQSAYRGTENQLYRVEIHTGGANTASPVFKWSRENGSVVFPILKLATSAGQTTVTLANLGRDQRLSLQHNDWVEVVDDIFARSGQVDSLLQVTDIDVVNQVVTLSGTSGVIVGQPSTTHPILRRWDGTGPITESGSDWLTLEDGIQIQFQPPAANAVAAQYRSGDYWLIPARVATGNIEWPQQTDSQGNSTPAARTPHGVEHHYAPLAMVSGGSKVISLRRTYDVLAK